jgi:stress response protein YsnF
MHPDNDELVIPVIREELHADVKPVQTGRVRVTKTVDHHRELLEQQLKKGYVEVRRAQTNKMVDGPQEPYRSGDTVVVPVASEVLMEGQKRWQVTEEIYLVQREQVQTVQQTVDLAEEKAKVERVDAQGKVTQVDAPSIEHAAEPKGLRASPIVFSQASKRKRPAKRVLSSRDSILEPRRPKP